MRTTDAGPGVMVGRPTIFQAPEKNPDFVYEDSPDVLDFWRARRAPGRPDLVRKLALQQSRLLRHRGPDWSGIWTAPNAVLAHERLAIVVVYDSEVPRQSVLTGDYRIRRCGVEFTEHNWYQSFQLDMFIKDFTVQE